MAGVLAAASGGAGAKMTPSAAWGNIVTTGGGATIANANVTLTGWSGARNVRVTHTFVVPLNQDFEYRVNSGAYINCPTDTLISVSSGDTLNFRIVGASSSNAESTVTVTDDSGGGYTVGTFIATIA